MPHKKRAHLPEDDPLVEDLPPQPEPRKQDDEEEEQEWF